MKIAFNPSTVAALITPPNNKDITFDLRGRNIFARGVKFCGTDTWRDIKINNVSIGSNILDLRNGSNTTLTNTNGVVTINSTWRPVVDNLTSNSTTSSLSANQGRVLKALIDGKSDSEHTHDDRYLKLTGGIMQLGEGLKFHADENYFGTSADARIISLLDQNDKICDGGLIIDERGTFDGKEYVTELLRIRDSEFKWKGSNILHSGNSNINGNTITINGSSLTVSKSDHIHDYLVINRASESTLNSAYHNFQVLFAGGSNGLSGRPSGVDAFGLIRLRAADGYSGQMLLANGGSLYIRSSTDEQMTNTLAWKTILDSSNYLGILDDRYYTESEVNSLLSNKLNTSDFNWTNLPGKLVAGNEFNVVNAGFSESFAINYLPINNRNSSANISTYIMYNGNRGLASVYAKRFKVEGQSCMWKDARNYAPFYATFNGGFEPILDIKTVGGDWSIGSYDYVGNYLIFSFTSDSDYNAGVNGTAWYYITTDGTFSGASRYINHTPGDPQSYMYSTSTGTYGGAIQIREVNGVQSNQSAWGYAPRITFHWDQRYAKGFGMRSDGQFAVDDVPIALTSNVLTFSNESTNCLSANFNNSDFSKKAASKYIECWDSEGGWWNWMAGKFMKAGSSDDYVLLGGGGHKAESSLNVANADTVDGYHANQLCRIYTFNVHNSIIKVGILTSGQYGHVCKLRFNSGSGYNAENQDKTMTVVIRASNGDANSNGFYFEAHSESYRGGAFTTFYLHQTSKTQCELYMDAFNYSGQSTYEVSFSDGDSWVNEISVQNALPTSNIFTLPNYQIAYTDYNVASATKLQTPRSIWGNLFDGTNDIGGTILPSATHKYNLGSATYMFEKTYTRYIDTDSGYDLRLCCSGIEVLRLASADKSVNINYDANISGKTNIANDLKVYNSANHGCSVVIGEFIGNVSNGGSINVIDDNGYAPNRRPLILQYGQGNVGIGTNAPIEKLDVVGNIRATGNSYATHFYESSDKTLKKNIKSILSSTNIPKIREFDWKDTGEHSYGFIAQELEEQGYGCLVNEANGKKTVNYTATLALTVAKLQNLINIQNKKISNLTKELKALKYGRKKNS